MPSEETFAPAWPTRAVVAVAKLPKPGALPTMNLTAVTRE